LFTVAFQCEDGKEKPVVDVMEPKKYRLLTPQDVADMLQMSLKKVYRLLQAGKIKNHKLGGQRRIKPEDLDAYIDQEEQQSE
jgi:excisionase family DNA binding protein